MGMTSYCCNEGVNHTTNDGLFFGFVIGVFAAIFGAIGTAIAVVAKVVVEVLLTVVVSIVNAVGTLLVNLFDKVPWLKSVLISGFASEQGVSTWRILIHSAAIAGAGAISAFAQGKKPSAEETQADVNLKTAIEDALEALRRNKNCKKLLDVPAKSKNACLLLARRSMRQAHFALSRLPTRGSG
jgi:hypothetical protein